jgi:hypothetical protein
MRGHEASASQKEVDEREAVLFARCCQQYMARGWLET